MTETKSTSQRSASSSILGRRALHEETGRKQSKSTCAFCCGTEASDNPCPKRHKGEHLVFASSTECLVCRNYISAVVISSSTRAELRDHVQTPERRAAYKRKRDEYAANFDDHEGKKMRNASEYVSMPSWIERAQELAAEARTHWGIFWSTDVLNRGGVPYDTKKLQSYSGMRGLFRDRSLGIPVEAVEVSTLKAERMKHKETNMHSDSADSSAVTEAWNKARQAGQVKANKETDDKGTAYFHVSVAKEQIKRDDDEDDWAGGMLPNLSLGDSAEENEDGDEKPTKRRRVSGKAPTPRKDTGHHVIIITSKSRVWSEAESLLMRTFLPEPPLCLHVLLFFVGRIFEPSIQFQLPPKSRLKDPEGGPPQWPRFHIEGLGLELNPVEPQCTNNTNNNTHQQNMHSSAFCFACSRNQDTEKDVVTTPTRNKLSKTRRAHPSPSGSSAASSGALKSSATTSGSRPAERVFPSTQVRLLANLESLARECAAFLLTASTIEGFESITVAKLESMQSKVSSKVTSESTIFNATAPNLMKGPGGIDDDLGARWKTIMSSLEEDLDKLNQLSTLIIGFTSTDEFCLGEYATIPISSVGRCAQCSSSDIFHSNRSRSAPCTLFFYRDVLLQRSSRCIVTKC